MQPKYIRHVDHLNLVGSKDAMTTAADYSVYATVKAATTKAKTPGIGMKKQMLTNTFSVGTTNSEISTTVMAHSLAARGKIPTTCNSVNFGELGGIAASINDTPRSRKSVDLKARKLLTKQRTSE